jgi:hypothetical protein
MNYNYTLELMLVKIKMYELKCHKSLIFKPGAKLKLVHFNPGLILILDQNWGGGGGGLRGYFSLSSNF